jgi:hypothetical protein
MSVNARGEDVATFVFQHSAISGKSGQFTARTSDPKVIEKARRELAKPKMKRHLFLDGKLASGDAQINKPWHWHIVNNRWDLVEMSIELCDGTPEMVEKDVAHWVKDVKRFCPWKSYVVEEKK